MGGFGGGLGPGGMGGPLAPPRLASPETTMRSAPQAPEGRTVLASPLADRVAGPLMQEQQIAQQARQLKIAKDMIEGVARAWTNTDPKRAADLLQILARLTKTIPEAVMPPTSPAGVMQRAQGMPGVGGPMSPGGAPPPPAVRPPTLSGPPGV